MSMMSSSSYRSKSTSNRTTNTTTTSEKRSLLSRAKLSFSRSHGERGADIHTLRGTTSADFEGPAKVMRGNTNGFWQLLFFCFKSSTSTEPTKVRYVFAKGSNIFIFTDKDAPSPKYAIDLAHKHVSMGGKKNNNKGSSRNHKKCVYLENAQGDIEYKFMFTDEEQSKAFLRAMRRDIVHADVDEVKERLGHEKLTKRSDSQLYLQQVAKEKLKAEPPEPVHLIDMMEEVNTMTMEPF